MEIKTLKDLKEFLGPLNEKQLNQRAFLCVEDEVYYINDADFNDERCVWNEDMDDGNIPVDCYQPDDFDGRPIEHEDNKIYEVGDIVILSGD